MMINRIDEYRKQYGFYTVDEIVNEIALENVVFDPYSLLISKNVHIGKENVFYSNIIIKSDDTSLIKIGNRNTFFNNTNFIAENGGVIEVGNENVFSGGPISIKANMNQAQIIFSDEGRYDGNINVYGNCYFGRGSQILGNINVYSCKLEAGASYKDPDPDCRAGLIKGLGTAKNLVVPQGKVINGWHEFKQEQLEDQNHYHSKKRRAQ